VDLANVARWNARQKAVEAEGGLVVVLLVWTGERNRAADLVSALGPYPPNRLAVESSRRRLPWMTAVTRMRSGSIR